VRSKVSSRHHPGATGGSAQRGEVHVVQRGADSQKHPSGVHSKYFITGIRTCGCREPYPSRSGYGAVLVNQPGNNIGSSHVFRFGIGDRDDHFGDR